ncbi:MAG: GntR family transcriptional regulator [Chloroflexi bacterium]|nr:GntR family transcriptional regulator [Chloroflexota bacterium]
MNIATDNVPLAAAIRERLREAILRGDFTPGERLREVDIAGRHEVSRGPVREALLQLEQEGLVLLRRNRGAVVARLSRADLEEVYSLRLALERLAVARTVQHGTEVDFGVMDAVLHEFRGAASDQPLTEQQAADQDVRFHDAIYRAAHHERLYAAWRSIRSQVYVLLLGRNVAGPDFREDTYMGHLELAYLIRARDERRAVRAIEQHLEGSYQRVLASYPAAQA